MSHMPYDGSSSACSDGSCGGRIVSYTATGAESPAGFTVPIGTTLASADYHVAFFSVEADIIVPIAWAFGSKTTTQFQARFAGDGLSAGGTYFFQIVE